MPLNRAGLCPGSARLAPATANHMQDQGRLSSRPFLLLGAPLRLDLLPDQDRNIRSAYVLYSADACRRGDIDLRQIAVDRVKADKEEAAFTKRGSKRRADLALTRRKFSRLRGAAAHHIGAQVVGRRHAVDRARELAVDQDDALVTLLYGRQELLHHPGLAESRGEHVVKRAEVQVVAGD